VRWVERWAPLYSDPSARSLAEWWDLSLAARARVGTPGRDVVGRDAASTPVIGLP
jgi:hypothetical protein